MNLTISVNGGKKDIVKSMTIADLLKAENVDSEARFVAVAINNMVIPRSKWCFTEINQGDSVEIVRPAPGG